MAKGVEPFLLTLKSWVVCLDGQSTYPNLSSKAQAPFQFVGNKSLWKKDCERNKTVEHKRDFLPSNKLQEESCMHKIPLYYHFHQLLWEDSAFFSYRPMISKASGLLTPHLKSKFQLKSVGSLNRSWEIEYFAEHWPPISVHCLTHKLYLQLLLMFIHWHISGAYRCF